VTEASLPVEQPELIRMAVRDRYRQIATGGGCCGPTASASGCCGSEAATTSSGGCCEGGGSVAFGYSAAELASLPAGADLGLGCGNPLGLLSLRADETVLDLGSGAGIDCLLASRRVGTGGHVIGVDMTPEMLAKARANAERGGHVNVEFRLGEIEHLPVADRSVDVVLSNCVINLVPEPVAAYREAFRVLRPGGRLAIADVVATRPISAAAREDLARRASCLSGAIEASKLPALLSEIGFESVRVELLGTPSERSEFGPETGLGVVSAEITATRPLE
jgi:arsenite methyltransferase